MTETMATTTETRDTAAERLTLRKSAKLRHRTLVNRLFEKGKSVYSGPLRLTFRALSDEELAGSFKEAVPDLLGPVQIMITVPKKKRRHAVDRVLMRRRIREAFRLQHRQLRCMVQEDPSIRTLSVGIVYMQGDNCDMATINSAMASALAKIRKKLWPQPTAVDNC